MKIGKELEEIWGDLQAEFEKKALRGMDKSVQRSKHAKEQMKNPDRDISWDDVVKVSKEMPEEFFLPDTYPPEFNNPDPVFSITGRDAKGRKITIAIAVNRTVNRAGESNINFTLITAMLVKKGSRHDKTNC